VERKGTVFRSIDHLDISDKAKLLANELAEQIDMPIVFLIDHDLDKQYAMRNQVYHNQFWVLANHRDETSEYERIILSNIYRGIQTRKRYLHPSPSTQYEDYLKKIENQELRNKHYNLYHELLHKISALVTTIDAEHFLKAKGFETSLKQKEWLYKDRISILDDYIKHQKHQSTFRWYWEVEYINILDYSRIASFHQNYHTGIINRLKKIIPPSSSKKCIQKLSQLIKMIDSAEIKYQGASQEEVADWMTQEIIKIMNLEGKLVLEREYALAGCFYFKDGSYADIYSFVPDDINNKNIFIHGLRYANECILLLQEYYATFLHNTLPDVHVNLIYDSKKNAYANILEHDTYISITSGLLSEIMHFLSREIEKVPSEYIESIGNQDVCRRLEKYAIFYITAHEYAHIINGDCKRTNCYQDTWDLINARENIADNFAKSVLNKVLLFQYRPDMNTDLLSRIREMKINHSGDTILLDLACKWCDQYFDRLRYQ